MNLYRRSELAVICFEEILNVEITQRLLCCAFGLFCRGVNYCTLFQRLREVENR